jgi:hypothetical protein
MQPQQMPGWPLAAHPHRTDSHDTLNTSLMHTSSGRPALLHANKIAPEGVICSDTQVEYINRVLRGEQHRAECMNATPTDAPISDCEYRTTSTPLTRRNCKLTAGLASLFAQPSDKRPSISSSSQSSMSKPLTVSHTQTGCDQAQMNVCHKTCSEPDRASTVLATDPMATWQHNHNHACHPPSPDNETHP